MATLTTKARKAPSKAEVINAAPRMDAEEKKWRAQDDLRTLQRAKEIEANRSRMAAAQREAKAQISVLAKVTKRK